MNNTLVLGCGKDRNHGRSDDNKKVIYTDLTPLAHPDMILDITKDWNNQDVGDLFDTIIAESVLEHCFDVVFVMEQIHDHLKDKGRVEILVPLAGSFNHFCDPTHFHGFLEQSFDYFDPSTEFGRKYSNYTSKKFKIISKKRIGYDIKFVLEKIVS